MAPEAVRDKNAGASTADTSTARPLPVEEEEDHVTQPSTRVTSRPSFRPILPALTTRRPVLRHVDGPRHQRRGLGRCAVSLCPRVPCCLASHQAYRRVRMKSGPADITSSTSSSSSLAGTRSTTAASTGNDDDGLRGHGKRHPDQSYVRLTLPTQMTSLPTLPLENDLLPAAFNLFHAFFTQHMERIYRILTPPPVTSEQKCALGHAKHAALARSLSSPLYCLHHVAAAHHQHVFRTDAFTPDRTTAVIHGKLMSLLRDELADIVATTAQSQEIILVVLTLVQLDMGLRNTSALAFHRKALRHLVANQGGLHRMGRQLPFVIVLDRLISHVHDEPPLFVARTDRAIRRPLKAPCVYGQVFEASAAMSLPIDIEVKIFCFDVCRTIELLEMERVDYQHDNLSADNGVRSKSRPNSKLRQEPPARTSDLTYLFFLKDSLSTDFVHINARLASQQLQPHSEKTEFFLRLSRAVLCAAGLVNYIVSQDGYMIPLTLHFAERVCIFLQHPDGLVKRSEKPKGFADWQHAVHPAFVGYPSLVSWMLFALTSTPLMWDGRTWCLETLSALLDHKHGDRQSGESRSELETQELEHHTDEAVPNRVATNRIAGHQRSWSLNWREQELQNVRSHVWSDSRLTDEFHKVCDQFDGPAAASRRW